MAYTSTPQHRRQTIRVQAVPYIPTSLGTTILKTLGYMFIGAIAYSMVMFIAFNIMTRCGQAEYQIISGTWMTGTCHPAWLFPDHVQNVRGTY
tara:strand:+ start:659 stop:937 length:279 start_codon:yes stop_codon:yes gene_type:complete